MAAQTNDKGQRTVHPFNEKPFATEMRTPRRQWSSHNVQRIATNPARDQWILSASCCCAGPVRDRHGRRFATFPRWWVLKILVWQIRSPRQTGASAMHGRGANVLSNVLTDMGQRHCDQFINLS